MSVLLVSICCSEKKVIKDRIYLKQIQGKSYVFQNEQKIEIRGVAGYTYLGEAKRAGATVVRTWEESQAQQVLDSAHALGLYVILGMHIEDPYRNGNAKEKIAQQKEKIVRFVKAYKDHPALLIWAVGNELDLYGRNIRAWRILNKYIRLVKSLDERHPVTTTTINGRRTIALSKIFLRDLDVLSVNTFGAMWELRKKLNMPIIGWNGPVIVSEWGINGPWEAVNRTAWGAPIELTSSAKVEMVRDRFETFLRSPGFDCVGSFVFYWGNKTELTNTWFSVFSREGQRSSLYYWVKELHGRVEQENLPPEVCAISLNGKQGTDDIMIQSGEMTSARLEVFDHEDDSLTYRWQVLKDNVYLFDVDTLMLGRPKSEVGHLLIKGNELQFKADLQEGPYRLHVEVYDGHKNFAYANLPFYVLR